MPIHDMLGPQVDKVKTLQTSNTKKGKRIIELRNKPSRKKTGKVRTEGGSGGEGCSGNKVIITNKVPNAQGSFIIYLNPKKTKNCFSCSRKKRINVDSSFLNFLYKGLHRLRSGSKSPSSEETVSAIDICGKSHGFSQTSFSFCVALPFLTM
ncbi:hypothetical protein TNCV_4389971 [Trichonephila clavipes]|nr:hypothetical protein TNCV_4389971 [Trichonephila clavipes]